MKIQLNDTWYITSDSHCFKLCKLETKTDKDGNIEEYLSPICYYTTFNSCLKAFVDERVKEFKNKKLDTLSKDINSIIKEIKNIYDLIDRSNDTHISYLRKLLKNEIDLEELDNEEE